MTSCNFMHSQKVPEIPSCLISLPSVCLCRCSSADFQSWQWCQSVSWISTASWLERDILTLTQGASKPLNAASSTHLQTKAHRWRGERSHWGEASVLCSHFTFISYLLSRTTAILMWNILWGPKVWTMLDVLVLMVWLLWVCLIMLWILLIQFLCLE